MLTWIRVGAVVLLAVFVMPAVEAREAAGPRLRGETAAAWNAYVAAVEARRAAERRGPGFLVVDHAPNGGASRREVMRGAVLVERMAPARRGGREIDVPSAMVHHWRGAIFLPGATLDGLLKSLQTAPPKQEDVLRSSVLERGPNHMRVYLRLRRTKIVTVVYNTEHLVRFSREGKRAESWSVATRIAELEHAGTRQEQELAPGDDRGFLWRLNSYWRYESVPGGVIAECESISLSRSVPFGLRSIASPIVASTAKESLEKALRALLGASA